jgi:hypothetical protein
MQNLLRALVTRGYVDGADAKNKRVETALQFAPLIQNVLAYGFTQQTLCIYRGANLQVTILNPVALEAPTY